jgi:hypothetical protein
MKLVSFDVGLRNLAYCILEGTNRSNIKIPSWDLIDVMAESSGHNKPICHKCKKPANWSQGTQFACTKHKTGTKTFTKTSLSKKTLEELKTESSLLKIVGTTKKALVDGLYAYYSGHVWKRCIKSCKQGSVVDLAKPIADSLEARREVWKDADLIVFEQQPDKRMMAVQAMMHMWFVCQGFKVKGVSAVHKLSNIITVEDSTKTYKGRKKTGILHAAELVPTVELKTYMMKHPKKDDLADCFLQGLWVLENMRSSFHN